mgnify:CR=1 FL=1
MNERIFKHIGWLNKLATALLMSTLVACGGGNETNNTNPPPSGTPPSGSAINVKLSWNPNPGSNVDGYAINYGSSSGAVNTSAANIPTGLPSFDPSAPSIVFDVAAKFGAVTGDQICFNVRAYNDAGFTTPSSSVCITV